MKNTVIANRKKEDWPIIKKYFENRGYTGLGSGTNIADKDTWGYYGVINDRVALVSREQAQQANATILEVSDIVDTVTVPKSFVLEAHRSACKDWEKRIEEVVPELFPKNELIVGKWYKEETTLSAGKRLVFAKKIIKNEIRGYGFNGYGNWEDDIWYNSLEGFEPATEEEVFEALRKEAVRRGFKGGVSFKCFVTRNFEKIDGKLEIKYEDGELYSYVDGSLHHKITENGKWAEIQKLPKSLQKAIDEIGRDEIIKLLKN